VDFVDLLLEIIIAQGLQFSNKKIQFTDKPNKLEPPKKIFFKRSHFSSEKSCPILPFSRYDNRIISTI
jgi:hypothetical protein